MLKFFKVLLICFLLNIHLSLAQAQTVEQPFEFSELSNKLSKIESNLKNGNYSVEEIEDQSQFFVIQVP